VLEEYFTPQVRVVRKRGNIRRLNAKKRAILRNEEYFDTDAFDHVQDELDYAYAV